MEQSELDLIASAAAGDIQSQTALYQRYQPLVLGYLIRLLGSVPVAEDICQDSFVKAFRGITNYRGEASFKNWLFMIVKHRVADYWKEHYSRQAVSLEEWVGREDEPIETEAAQDNNRAEAHLQAILQQLPEDYRLILEYRFLRGYSIKETAAALQISESNAKVRQYRALQQAKQLGDSTH